ncbi:MAG: hypothetical protein QNJ13_08685 [Paracoccaceae bacterium]|nr:hypothetical protein [Paracoccaceae bacterium]
MVDGERPEIQRALADMNWDARLKKARAQREAILRERAAAGQAGDRPKPERPPMRPLDLSETAPVAVDIPPEKPRVDEATAVVAANAAARSGQRQFAYIVGGFCAGIAVAIGLMVLASPLLNRSTLTSEPFAALPQADAPAPGAATLPGAEAPTNAAQPLPTETLPAGEAPAASDRVLVGLRLPAETQAPTLPAATAWEPAARVDLAALAVPSLDGLPDLGAAIPPLALAEAAGEPAAAPAIGDRTATLAAPAVETAETEITNLQFVAARGPFDGVGATARRLPDIQGPAARSVVAAVEPARPAHMEGLAASLAAPPPEAAEAGADLVLAALGDTLLADIEALALTPAPETGAPPNADIVPPEAIIIGASALPVSVFAAESVEQSVVDEARGTAESLNLPVRAVSRVGYRISQNQVRYYDATSAAAAARLAEELGAVARDFTGSDFNPPPGTLEVYLAGVSLSPPPQRRPQVSAAERLRNNVLSQLRSGNLGNR